ncbi:MAG: IS200/IS605 family transposase [Thermomicrobiales bacterium]|nr:IS200/IS605 family transposase [Thermomicrobiales bacterium]MCO5222745.1 IS200/IS605 family transposase [Thermomicrobiales bacterium]
MTYWRCFYHLVWGTKRRVPSIDEERADVLMAMIPGIAREEGALVHAIGIMPDHVHVAISIPPRVSVAQVVSRLKGSTSHRFGHDERSESWFGWQAEYGVMSLTEKALPTVVDYVRSQPQRHAGQELYLGLEQMEVPYQSTQ